MGIEENGPEAHLDDLLGMLKRSSANAEADWQHVAALDACSQ